MEVRSVGPDELLGYRIVELPPLVLRRVTHKNCLLHVRRQTNPLVPLDMDKALTAKDPEERNIRLLAEQGLKGCGVREGGAWSAIVGVDDDRGSFTPELLGKLGLIQQRGDPVADSTNGPLCKPIRMRLIPHGMPPLDSSLSKVLLHLLGNVLPVS